MAARVLRRGLIKAAAHNGRRHGEAEPKAIPAGASRICRVVGLSARIVRPDALSPNESALWRALCERDPSLAHPFYAFAFVRAVARAHPHVYVGLLERGGDVVGFMPFQFGNRQAVLLRAAERAGAPLADRFGVVAAKDLQLSSVELLRLLRLNSLVFAFLPKEQARHGLDMQVAIEGQHARLHADYWSTLKTGSRKFVSQIERNERLLASELGGLRATFVADPAAELPRLIEVKGQQYGRSGQKNPLTRAWIAKLFHELLASNDPQCRGVLSTLYAGDVWLASHLGVMSKRVFHYWFPVYNRQYARFSPGNILMKNLVVSSAASGIEYFDMARSSEYKSHLRPDPYVYHAGFWRGKGLGGLLAQSATSLSWRLDRLRRSQSKHQISG